jgi:CubicO group peptidase (beta-lactamase class C family)
MPRLSTISLAISLAAACLIAIPALAAPPDRFDARVESLRKGAGAPGVSIAIVEAGRTTLARGYGIRKLGERARVDADTIFPTGSTGKAFTVAGLALLVDQGRIGWDDKVIEHMPWFRMYDPWVTREITVRDLLVHRSGLGLGAGDLLFIPRSNLSRKESVRRLAYLEPATSFRSGFAYDNVLYMVAGQLIEEVTGQTWEVYTAEHLFKPAGMKVSTSDSASQFATENRAHPHARLNGGIRGAGDQELLDERDELGANSAPAGGLAISANDMSRWLAIQLAHGALPEGGRLFSEASAKEMWNPVVPQPLRELPPPLEAAQPEFQAYALGWVVRDYRGTKIVWHSGGVLGHITVVALIPGENVGFAIMVNSEDVGLLSGLMFELLDHYVGAPFSDWPEKWSTFYGERIAAGLESLASQQAEPADVGPSLPLEGYADDYADPWYGRIEVRSSGDKLSIDFKSTPRMSGALEHWQYDTFITRFEDRTIEPAYVTFSLDAEGSVERVTMKAVSPLADFSYDYHDLLFTPIESDQ